MTPKLVSNIRLWYSWYFHQIWWKLHSLFKIYYSTGIAINCCINRQSCAAIMDFVILLFLCFFIMILIIWYKKKKKENRKRLFLAKVCLITINPKINSYIHTPMIKCICKAQNVIFRVPDCSQRCYFYICVSGYMLVCKC